MRRVIVALIGAAVLAACTTTGGGNTVVGSFYPPAWAAEEIGGSEISVIDLTPPGVEAHDINLNARQVGEIQSAKVVFILGDIGFQPQVESAARDAEGDVVALTAGLPLRPAQEHGISADPHVWLDPVLMESMAETMGRALERAFPGSREQIADRTHDLSERLDELNGEYAMGLMRCRYDTFVTTHEAFGYLASRYHLTQIGIEGITPEAEPSASRLQSAEDAIRDGVAAPAVFYEDTADGKRIGQSVGSDLDVPAIPLSTLEFEPESGDYVSVMRDNLANLQKSLQCK